MKLKLFKKYFFTNTVIILLSFTVMSLILSVVLNGYIARSEYKTLNNHCKKISEFITEESLQKDSKDFIQIVNVANSLSSVSNTDIFVTDSSGKIIICGCNDWQIDNDCFHSDYTVSKKFLHNARNQKKIAITNLDIYKNPHYMASKTVKDSEGKELAYVFSVAPLSIVKGLMQTMSRLYLVSATIPIILMFFAIYAMTYRLTKPLKLMSNAAKAMAKGDFSKRIPVTSDDEIGELAVSFNMMTNSLSHLEGMRKSFVANISHELKTPMTTISGFIDGILDGTIEEEKQKYYLEIVSEEVKRLSRLVYSMLSMAKLESGELKLNPEMFDFRELLCTIAIGQEQRISAQKLDIIGLDEIEETKIYADKDLIHQVVYNLVDNAIKFTNEGGKIDFKLSSDKNNLTFIITNSGNGIPQKELGYVFERFYKVDKSRSHNKNSTGLGLYIVKMIVNTHGGTIAVASKEGEYTSFKVVLPLKDKGED